VLCYAVLCLQLRLLQVVTRVVLALLVLLSG
jgi:hypothetical protein